MESDRSVPLDRVRTLHRVILAGFGALMKAREEGRDELFRELVKKGREMEAQGVRAAEGTSAGPDLAEEGREILAYAGVLERWARERQRFERMVDAMMPETPLPTPPAVLQARRNAAAREELISEFGVLSSTGVASLAGSKAKNKASLANRWKQEGRIFSVPHRGAAYFPGFQFDGEGRPREAVAGVLEALGPRISEWGLGLWFTAANGTLGGKRPVDLLENESERVVGAAEREAAELVY
ncbi:MAG TPA: phasin family protein [Thermoanaerobaculia bacterium]|nr:phasin family protein [Thermoanaerobaculia bacterium]